VVEKPKRKVGRPPKKRKAKEESKGIEDQSESGSISESISKEVLYQGNNQNTEEFVAPHFPVNQSNSSLSVIPD